MLTLRRATLIVDLDHLQGLSRQLGDEDSKELLHFAEWRITATIGASGVVGALGRGKFRVALHKEVDEASVHRVSSRLHKFLRAPFTLRGREIFTSASIGIALGFAGADALERNAEDAVRRVKSNGGDATFLIRATVPSHPVAAA